LAKGGAGICRVLTAVSLTGKRRCRFVQSGDDSESHWHGTVQVYTGGNDSESHWRGALRFMQSGDDRGSHWREAVEASGNFLFNHANTLGTCYY
jgi:hypothetical protein